MSPIQQQRLIGVILLVSIISGIAFFFMSNAGNPELIATQDIAPEIKPVYTSVVEAIPEGDVEIVNNEVETLVDPHNLSVKKDQVDIQEEKKAPTQTELKETIKEPTKETIKEPIKETVKKTIPDKTVMTRSSGWLLQLGSFSVKKNANKMQQQVATLGYKANIEAVKTSSGSVYRVRIGPKNTKSEIDTIANVLNQRLKIRSQVIKKEN